MAAADSEERRAVPKPEDVEAFLELKGARKSILPLSSQRKSTLLTSPLLDSDLHLVSSTETSD